MFSFVRNSELNYTEWRPSRGVLEESCFGNLILFLKYMLTLIWLRGGARGNLPRLFSLNNLEMVKSCNPGILQRWVTFFSRHSCQTLFLTRLSLQILSKTQTGISDFRISGQSLIKGNCHNFRTSDDIDMKLCPVTKLDKRNKTSLKKIYDEVMSENCDFITIFSIYGQFGEIRKPDSGRIVCKTYIFVKSNLSSYTKWKQN